MTGLLRQLRPRLGGRLPALQDQVPHRPGHEGLVQVVRLPPKGLKVAVRSIWLLPK